VSKTDNSLSMVGVKPLRAVRGTRFKPGGFLNILDRYLEKAGTVAATVLVETRRTWLGFGHDSRS
jgi:hypothetical protein